MTKDEKRKLKRLVKSGLCFKKIRRRVNCSDATIKKYIKYLRN